jgi:hypothetical protein
MPNYIVEPTENGFAVVDKKGVILESDTLENLVSLIKVNQLDGMVFTAGTLNDEKLRKERKLLTQDQIREFWAYYPQHTYK